MPLCWNGIKDRALAFSRKWEDEDSEDAEAKSFWDDFFNVFGISRRRVASFEEPVRKLGDKYGYIDLFWKGVLLVEHKSRGKDLDKAVDAAYLSGTGRKPFKNDTERVAFLFELYQQYTSLLPMEKSPGKKKKTKKRKTDGRNSWFRSQGQGSDDHRGRPVEPEEIAGAVIYLASDAGRFVTGHTLLVDGGFTAV